MPKLSTVIQKAIANCTVKLMQPMVAAMTRYCMEQGAGVYIDSVVRFHANHVNPKTTSVSHTIFEDVAKLIPTKYVLVKEGLTCLAYSRDTVSERVPPAPDVCTTLHSSTIASLGQNLTGLDMVEDTIRSHIVAYKSDLDRCAKGHDASYYLRHFQVSLTRFMCGEKT